MTAPDQDQRENSADVPAPAVTQHEDKEVHAPQRRCRYCDDPMSQNPTARVCKACGRHQRRWVQYFPYFGNIPSFGLLILAIIQLSLARSDRKAAEIKLQRIQGVESNISFIAGALIDFTLSENKKMVNLTWADLEEPATKANLSLMYDKANVILDRLQILKSQRPAVMNEVESILQPSPSPQ